MVKIGAENIGLIFAGASGIKRGVAGGDVVYERPGGYIFIELIGTSRAFVPAESSGVMLDANNMEFRVK